MLGTGLLRGPEVVRGGYEGAWVGKICIPRTFEGENLTLRTHKGGEFSSVGRLEVTLIEVAEKELVPRSWLPDSRYAS